MTDIGFPAHPGFVIKNELEELGLSVSEAAKRLGVSRQQLHNIIAGKSAVTAEMALRLELGLGGTARLWLTMQGNHDLAQVRLRADLLQVQPKPMVAAE